MSVLFHHDVVVAVLGSGSRGNATYIGDGRHGVLVDCGLSTRQVHKRLEAVGLSGVPIDAVLLTHEHADHVGAAGVLSRRLLKDTGRRVPFFMSRGTRRGLPRQCVPERTETIRAGVAFRLGRWKVEPYSVPHDTADPVAYVVDLGPLRIGVVTDLGHVTRLVQRKLASCDVAVVEFNHDEEMLIEGPYPWHLKQRIRGRHGHLSNLQAEDLVVEAVREGRLREVVLAHLSEENNTPDRALLAASRALQRAGRQGVRVRVAQQDEPLEPTRRQVPVTPLPTGTPAAPRRTRSRAEPLAPGVQQTLFDPR